MKQNYNKHQNKKWNNWINTLVWQKWEELYTEETPECQAKTDERIYNDLKEFFETELPLWKERAERARTHYKVSGTSQIDNASVSLTKVLRRCRHWLQCIWKDHADIHDEEAMFAIANELKVSGATEDDIHEFCKYMLEDKYDKNETSKRWKYIKGNPFKITTLKDKLPDRLQNYLR